MGEGGLRQKPTNFGYDLFRFSIVSFAVGVKVNEKWLRFGYNFQGVGNLCQEAAIFGYDFLFVFPKSVLLMVLGQIKCLRFFWGEGLQSF